MDEYIKRELAIEALSRGEGCGNVCRRAIERVHAADVAPVRHGRWIETPRLYYGAKQYECSLCYSDAFWNKHCITEKYPHCPNCGAIMDLNDLED